MSDQPDTSGAHPDPTPASAPSPGRSWWEAFRAWPRPARIATSTLAGLLTLALVLALTTIYVARKPLPDTDETLTVAGLDQQVRVLRDGAGIPQIYGATRHDVLFAQGYVHAQERFFEMDMRRHYTAGRLSELFGSATLDVDRMVRTLGWRRVAEQELALVSPDTRAALQDYADGVNAYLAGRGTTDLAVEYDVLRLTGSSYTPEPWTPVDSLAWLKAMAWDLRGNMDEEIARVLIGVDHTDAEVDRLYPPYDEQLNAPIVPGGSVVDGQFREAGSTGEARRPAYGAAERRALARVDRVLQAMPTPVGVGDGIGSNSWVVSGKRSATGAPILANDPHLAVSVPGVWMPVGLHCAPVSADCPLDVAGFSFSGTPGIVIGHNADIAWGFTNLGADVTDLYLERLDRGRWRHGGRWRPLTTRTETIRVAGEDDVTLTVRSTRHGPLLSDVDQELSSVGANAAAADRREEYAVSLAWTGLTPRPTADAILGIDLAGDWPEFRAAAADFAVPAQNLVYADRAGHIGYQAPGLLPIRGPRHDGRTPAPGWKKGYDWRHGYIPFAALPRMLDPDEGVIVAANQQVIGGDYPYSFGDDMDHGYRSQRIRELLGEQDRWTVADLARLQLDDYNPMAPVLVPYLLDIDDLGGSYARSGQDLLREWDYHQPVDSAAAAYYNAVWANLLRLTFHDEIRESLWPEGGQRWFAVLTNLLRDPDDSWWDDRTTDYVVETRDDILRQALLDARDDLTRHQSLEPDQWAWGLDHRLELTHAALGASGIAPIEALVNRGGWQVAGGSSIVNASSWDATSDFTVTSAASMRMVVSLDDLDASRWINLTGVSGHPASSHYVDQTDLWARGETLAWAFSADAVAAAAEDELTLQPAAPAR